MVFSEMKLPVRVEVARRSDGAQAQDGFRPGEGPARARAVHAVLHEVPACSFNDAGRDREAVAESLPVMHQPRARPVREVVARNLDGLPSRIVELLLASGPPANGASDVSAAPPREEREKAVADPVLGLGVALSEESPRRVPDVFEDMHEVDEDGDFDPRAPCLLLDRAQLLWLPV